MKLWTTTGKYLSVGSGIGTEMFPCDKHTSETLHQTNQCKGCLACTGYYSTSFAALGINFKN